MFTKSKVAVRTDVIAGNFLVSICIVMRKRDRRIAQLSFSLATFSLIRFLSPIGLLKSIRSHYIDSPDAEQSSSVGRPNACNLCHLDKSHEWTANYLSEWYGYPAADLPAEDSSTAASLLQLLGGDAGQRALIASHMGWTPAQEASGTGWFAPFLAELLNDDYSEGVGRMSHQICLMCP